MIGGEGLRLDNPVLVQWEFASEERLARRNSIYRELVSGVNAEDVLFDAVRECGGQHVLEVGCGTGELAERLVRELGSEVVAVDISPRMVELTKDRGVDARVADAQSLPFDDDSFDCIVSGWVLYHVADRDRAIAEHARVLRPGGRAVFATMASNDLHELWELIGAPGVREVSFNSENGEEQLRRHFGSVERREASGVVLFDTPEHMRSYVSADISRAPFAPNVPEFTDPFPVHAVHAVFVATEPL